MKPRRPWSRRGAAGETGVPGETSAPGETGAPDDEPPSLSIEVRSLAGGTVVRRAPRRRWVRALQIASVLAVIAVPFALFIVPRLPLPALAPVYHTPPLHLSLGDDASLAACPNEAAWSRDGAWLAILEYRLCPTNMPLDGTGGQVVIYATATWKPRTVVDLDALVRAKGLPASVSHDAKTMRTLAITYGSLDWSPDGHTLAISYGGMDLVAEEEPDGSQIVPQQDTRVNGLLLIPADAQGGSARALLAPIPSIKYSPHPVIDVLAPHPVFTWSLATGQESAVDIQPSLAYRWGADDTLIPTLPLTSATAKAPHVAVGPIGNPNGDTSFTLWQTAYLGITKPCASGNGDTSATSAGPHVYVLALSMSHAIWSPDGTTLVVGGMVDVIGRLDARVPAAALKGANGCSGGASVTSFPLLPVRDAGLRNLLAQVNASTATYVQWRGDGKRLLAIQMPTSDGGSSVTYRVMVYSCKSGDQLASFSVTISGYSLVGVPMFSWSPDGRHLVVLDHDGHAAMLYDATWLG